MTTSADDSLVLNREELARFFDVSLPTVDDWADSGMPVLERGKRGIPCAFDVPSCVKWVRERDAARARERVERLEAKQLEANQGRRSSGGGGIALATAFATESARPHLTLDAADIGEMFGWSEEDLSEIFSWGAPFIPGQPVAFVCSVLFRWLGLLGAALQHNGVSVGDFREMPATLRRLRCAAGLPLIVRTEVLSPKASRARLASLHDSPADGDAA